MVKKYTIKHNKNVSYTPSNIILTFLEILTIIKLFHWKTTQYSVHKSTDELYSSIQELMDTFVEQLMGTLDSRINMTSHSIPISDCNTLESFKKHIIRFKNYLEHLKLPHTYYDLYTVRDELLGKVNKFIYLYSLK
jgi:DNA-binding ferritin-like protein